MGSSEETLCYRHGTIKFLLQYLKKKLKSGSWDLQDLLEKVDEMIKEVTLAKKQGQRMENRLRRYRCSIENLGFVRVYKETK